MTRLTLLFTLASLLCTGCFTFAPRTDDRLTPIPTPPNQKAVQIYFPGEKIPDEPYIKIKLISAKNQASAATTTVVKELAAKAQREGADAILVLGKNNYTTTDETTVTTTDSTGSKTTTTSSSTDWQSVDALCIKYIKNITYLDQYVKEKQLLAFDGNSWTPVASIALDLNGAPAQRSGDANWIALVEDYELGNVWPEAKIDYLGWKKKDGDTSVTKWFRPRNPNWPLREYRLYKNLDGLMLGFDFRPTAGGKPAERGRARYFYDDRQRLSTRLLETAAYGLLFEQFYYDTAGKCLYSELVRTEGNQETPVLQVRYAYYQNGDLPELLRRER